jgi:hypothetical protein
MGSSVQPGSYAAAMDESNPYAAPSTTVEPPVPRGRVKPPLLLVGNSFVVLALTAAFVALSIPIIAFPSQANSPFAFLGAILLTPIEISFGIVVYLSVFRRSATATSIATACYFIGAGFTLFGVVTNVGEALLQGEPLDVTFLVVFVGIGAGIAAYSTFCGLLSWKWGRRLRVAVRPGQSRHFTRPPAGRIDD